MKPLAVDLYCGLGGWTEGLLAEGYDVIGFDIERHVYGEHRYPAQLVLQDVRTIHGAQFGNASLIVASSPCQEFSWRAMPWKAAKAAPPPFFGMELFAQAARIQREAIEASTCWACADWHITAYCDACQGTRRRFIPMVQENVRGAQKYVGRARWHTGSFYFWGDVPALMPISNPRKQPDDGSWFYNNYEKSARRFSSKSPERKRWTAEIAKIPIEVSIWIAKCFKPTSSPASRPISDTSGSRLDR